MTRLYGTSVLMIMLLSVCIAAKALLLNVDNFLRMNSVGLHSWYTTRIANRVRKSASEGVET